MSMSSHRAFLLLDALLITLKPIDLNVYETFENTHWRKFSIRMMSMSSHRAYLLLAAILITSKGKPTHLQSAVRRRTSNTQTLSTAIFVGENYPAPLILQSITQIIGMTSATYFCVLLLLSIVAVVSGQEQSLR